MELVYSLNNEDFIEYEEIEEMLKYEKEDFKIYKGIKEKYTHEDFINKTMLEDVADNAYEAAGDYALNYIEEIENKKIGKEFEEIVKTFFEEKINQPSFFKVLNIKEITLEEFKKDKQKIENEINIEEEKYYIQDSRNYVGNSVIWWGINGNGYTTNIEKAGLYSKSEAMEKFKNRMTDIPWKEKDVKKAILKHVDMQYLKRENGDTEIEDIKKDYIKKEREKEEIRRKKAYKNNMLNLLNEINFDIEKIEEYDLYVHELSYMDMYEIKEKIKKDFFKCEECKTYFHKSEKGKEIKEKKLCKECEIEKLEEEDI